MEHHSTLLRRLVCDNENPSADCLYGPDYAIRYGVTGGVIAAILLYFTIGYLHAQHRIKKGLPPMAYHRWMIRDPRRPMAYHPYYGPGGGFEGYREQHSMGPYCQRPQREQWAPPPPAYNAGGVPPAYVPPPPDAHVGPTAGASKMDPDQQIYVREVAEGEPSSSQVAQPLPAARIG